MIMAEKKKKVGVHITLEKCQRKNQELENELAYQQSIVEDQEKQLKVIKDKKTKMHYRLKPINGSWQQEFQTYPLAKVKAMADAEMDFEIRFLG